MAKQRVRDPIHGLIIFDTDSRIEDAAWKLINTPEFQRLRRIRQLGVSEFVFPSATHTRFAHSIGVFNNARMLMKVVHKSESHFNQDRANVVLLAALLHDIGHGPFSHTFEGARELLAAKNRAGSVQKHEKYSASIIRNTNGQIHEILENYEPGCAEEIAHIIESDNPSDIYHAVVSSSFDADRLDFLLRDRYMTGTGAGNIDEDWLVDNLSIAHVPVSQDDDAEIHDIPTFAFKLKGRAAAEDFLLARYRMYTQVYLHKTTRGFEKLLSSILQLIGDPDINPEKLGIHADNPLVLFLKQNDNYSFYEKIDDYTVWGAVGDIARSGHSAGADLARRFLNRERLMVIDVSSAYNDPSTRADPIRRIEAYVNRSASKGIYTDSPTYNLYTKGDGEGEKMHKIVRVLDGTGQPKQITEFPDTIISKSLTVTQKLSRYYFLDEREYHNAEKAMRGQ